MRACMRVAIVHMGLVIRTLPQPARNATSREGPRPMSCRVYEEIMSLTAS